MTTHKFRQSVSSDGYYLWSNAKNWTGGAPTDDSIVSVDISTGGNPERLRRHFRPDARQAHSHPGLRCSRGRVDGRRSRPERRDVATGNWFRLAVVRRALAAHHRPHFRQRRELRRQRKRRRDGRQRALRPRRRLRSRRGRPVDPRSQAERQLPVLSQRYQLLRECRHDRFSRSRRHGLRSGVYNVGFGSAIELPGNQVKSVAIGASSITVVTNVGKTIFANVSYFPGEVVSGYAASYDFISGLEKIAFTGGFMTDFQQSVSGGPYNDYLWSSASNWTSGAPTTAAASPST